MDNEGGGQPQVTTTLHPLAKRATLVGDPRPTGVRCTVDNVIKYTNRAIEIVRQMPPDTHVSRISAAEISLSEESFCRLFRGREVNQSEHYMWVYIGIIKIECWWTDRTPKAEKPSKWTVFLGEGES